MAADGSLNVIALVSGGKDSFFSVLHCLANGHRVVALANLHPPSLAPPPPGTGPDRSSEGANGACQGDHPSYDDSSPRRARAGAPVPGHGSSAESSDPGPQNDPEDLGETDLNSFMYQTVGHQVVPLYASATGLPLYRRPISGTAVDHGASYQDPQLTRPSSPRICSVALPSVIATGGNEDGHNGPEPPGQPDSQDTAPGRDDDTAEHEQSHEDETESLVPLLRTVMAAHPEANALCTGAILSTYQRTRVESVALRLGLVPLAYLWQYPTLPAPSPDGALAPRALSRGAHDDAQLLRDMATVGLDARIIKVASAGLDDGILWENVASEASIQRIQRALRRFGGGGRGSVLGEGGEFETLVIDGPRTLFKGRIVVPEDGKRVVREGGGSLWLGLREARLEPKPLPPQGLEEPGVRTPVLLDGRFEAVVTTVREENKPKDEVERASLTRIPRLHHAASLNSSRPWCFVGGSEHVDITEQTAYVVADIRRKLESQSLPATAITNSVILLRHMSDFPAINKLYGSLFSEPSPPARVTVACGACLPAGCGIIVYLTIQPALQPGERRGIHVQSRSYWAPANIGPYSQAVGFPISIEPSPSALPNSGDDEDEEGNAPPSQSTGPDSLRAISIAGQIPLVPASMLLPPGSGESANTFQVTLALQHLWRVGAEMRVQWWTSAAAYFPRTPSAAEMKLKAILAGRAWEVAHVWSPVSDADDESGPDLWDRKFNPQYMSLAGDGCGDNASVTLPDWGVLYGFDAEEEDAESRRCHVPVAFAAEVEELPRAAGVEWHAHLGLAELGDGSVCIARSKVSIRYPASQENTVELHHVVARSSTMGGSAFVHTTAMLSAAGGDAPAPAAGMGGVAEAVAARVAECLDILLQNPGPGRAEGRAAAAARPYLSYVVAAVSSPAQAEEATIPCYTLWDARGNSLAAVMLFQSYFNVTK